jgi:hypothetical protein
MKKNARLGAAKLLFNVATCLGVLVSSYVASSAQSAYSVAARSSSGSISTPAPVPMPSLLLEGRGQIAPSSPECTGGTCAGTFTATLSGRPFGKTTLALNLSVDQTRDAFSGCNEVLGTGGINGGNAYMVRLVGQLCTPGIGYTLSGTVQIYSPAATSSIAAVGTLLAFGGTNIPPNPIPSSGPSLVSIIGASGTIPLLLP